MAGLAFETVALDGGGGETVGKTDTKLGHSVNFSQTQSKGEREYGLEVRNRKERGELQQNGKKERLHAGPSA